MRLWSTLCAGLLWFNLAYGQLPVTPHVQVTMRDSGYTLGDYIHQRVTIHLPAHQTLQAESLPLTGYVKPWLDLTHVDVEQNGNVVALLLTWQVFATVEMSQSLKLPELVVKTDGQPSSMIRVPAQSFYYSSVLPSSVTHLSRRADVPPEISDEVTPILRTAIFGLLGTACLLCWLWLNDYLPWFPYRLGPIAALARQLKQQPEPQPSIAVITAIHRALNTAAGQSLYPDNLSRLFKAAPYLQAFEQEVRQYYTNTWYEMYAHTNISHPQVGDALRQQDQTLTLDWIVKAALAERLFYLHAKRQATKLRFAS